MRGSSRSTPLGLGLIVLAVLVLTLFPSSMAPGEEMSRCLVCGSRGTADAILNVLLFLPLGLASAAMWSVNGVFLIPPALSLLVEGIQILIPGRDASVGDLLFNSLGGAVGVLLYRRRTALLRPQASSARGLCLAASLLATGILVATGLLLAPSLTRSTYYGQWTPDLGNFETYEGEVLAARVDGFAVPEGPSSRTEAVRRSLLTGVNVEAIAVAGPAPSALAPVFSIYDGAQREIVLLGADRSDLVFRLRRRAAALKLDQPDVRLFGALRSVQRGDTVTLSARSVQGQLCLAAAPGPSRCGVGPTVGEGWALLLYPEHLGFLPLDLLTALWVGLLLAPVGFWLGPPVGRRFAFPTPVHPWRPLLSASLLSALLPFVALLLVPRLTAAESTPFWMFLAALAGVTGGAVVGRRVEWASRRAAGPAV